MFFTPPAVGSRVTKDENYTEVESVKAVSDVVAPLSGEVIAVNDELKADAPRRSTRTPTATGWLVRVKLSDPGEVDSLIDADGYRDSLD